MHERKKNLNYIRIGKANMSPNYQANIIRYDGNTGLVESVEEPGIMSI